MKQVYEYNEIHYNAAILHMEEMWNRPLTDHEKHLLKHVYNYARRVELENWMSDEVVNWQWRQLQGM